MNQRLRQLDSEVINCRMSPEQFQSFSLPSDHIHYATYFRYAIPEIVEEERILYLDCDMIFTQDLSPLFEVDLKVMDWVQWSISQRRQMALMRDFW